MLTKKTISRVWMKGTEYEKEFLDVMGKLYPFMASHSEKAVKAFEKYLEENLILDETDNCIHAITGMVDVEKAKKFPGLYWKTIEKEFDDLIHSKIHLESQPDINKVNMILIGTSFPAEYSNRDEIENAMASVFLHRMDNPPKVYVVRDRKWPSGEYYIAFIQ